MGNEPEASESSPEFAKDTLSAKKSAEEVFIDPPLNETTHTNPIPRQKQEKQQFSAKFSGPLPPPGLLKQYNEIIPNGAERLMKLVEKQLDSQESQRVSDNEFREKIRADEENRIKSLTGLEKQRTWTGFIALTTGFLGCALVICVLAYLKASTAAWVTIGTLITAFCAWLAMALRGKHVSPSKTPSPEENSES